LSATSAKNERFKIGSDSQQTPVREISFNHGKAAKLLKQLTRAEDWAGASDALMQLPAGSERSLNPQLLKSLGDGLYQTGHYENAANVYSSLLADDREAVPVVSLKLAAILLEINDRPKAALRVLNNLSTGQLTDKQERKCREIQRRSEQLIEAGHLEVLSPT
jgi:hypothetical protein